MAIAGPIASLLTASISRYGQRARLAVVGQTSVGMGQQLGQTS